MARPGTWHRPGDPRWGRAAVCAVCAFAAAVCCLVLGTASPAPRHLWAQPSQGVLGHRGTAIGFVPPSTAAPSMRTPNSICCGSSLPGAPTDQTLPSPSALPTGLTAAVAALGLLAGAVVAAARAASLPTRPTPPDFQVWLDGVAEPPALPAVPRRSALAAAMVGTAAGVASLGMPASAGALDLNLGNLFGKPEEEEGPLPKEYRTGTLKLVAAIRKTLEAEAAGAKESEVRKQGSDVRPLIKDFLDPKWEKTSAVVADPSFSAMKSAIRLLGQFYGQNGPRATMTEEARGPILALLAEAEVALEAAAPPAAQK
eukprot:EG_transcript_16389